MTAPKDTSVKDAGFDHPCKQTCSGWQQGYERGYQAALDGPEPKAQLDELRTIKNGISILIDHCRQSIDGCIALSKYDRARKDAE